MALTRSSYKVLYSRLSSISGFPLRRFSTEVAPSTQMDLIKQLRQRTSAPIKDVKSALVDCKWDIEAAQKDLRKRGLVLASKKASRTAAEGFLALAHIEGRAAVVELNCETDFVARNEIFQCLATSLANLALSAGSASQQVSASFPLGPEYFEDSKNRLNHPKLSGETTVQNAVSEVAAMMGENVKFRRGFVMSAPSGGIVSTYLHTSPRPGLGRIAGLVTLEVEGESASPDALQRVGSELAMHVVAAKPVFLTRGDVSSDAIESEREILKSQLTESKSMQGLCHLYAAVSYICIGDAESSSQALDIIGPIFRIMDSFVGVREKTCVLLAYGVLLMKQHNLQEARIRLATGLQMTHNHLGNLQLVSQYLTILGSLALALHDTVQAREILRSSLTLAKKLYDIPTQVWVLSVLTALYQELGEKGNELENIGYQSKKVDELRKRLAEAHSSIHHIKLVDRVKVEVQELHDTGRDIAVPSIIGNFDIPESVGLSTSLPSVPSRLLDFETGRRGKRKM